MLRNHYSPSHRRYRNILRLGVYQLLFMEKVPPSAACNEGAELAKKYGHLGSVKFVNGVLRSVSRRHGEINYPSLSHNPLEHISLRYSHPAWMVERWLAEFGPEETIELCRANNKPAPNTIRTNTLKITRARLVERLRGEGLTVSETVYAPEGLVIEGFLFPGLAAVISRGLVSSAGRKLYAGQQGLNALTWFLCNRRLQRSRR